MRKDDGNFELLAPEGKDILNKILDSMMEAGKTCMDGDTRCGEARTLVDHREKPEPDTFWERNVIVDE